MIQSKVSINQLINQERGSHGCAVTTGAQFGDQQLIIVAGGKNRDGLLDSVEFHLIGSQYWFRGNVLLLETTILG